VQNAIAKKTVERSNVKRLTIKLSDVVFCENDPYPPSGHQHLVKLELDRN
jgi:hypothetical protein